MGKTRSRSQKVVGVTLDAGALIALERRDSRVIALLDEVQAAGGKVHVPAGVVGQAWRGGSREAIVARLLATSDVEVVDLDLPLARACGELCAAVGSSDVIDASVVLVARSYGDPILTSDMKDLRRLDPKARLQKV